MADNSYRHRLLTERDDEVKRGREAFKAYVVAAHDDARRRLRAVAEDTLDPLEEIDAFDPAEGYPYRLERLTLTGYFGEVMAAMIAEHFEPGGHVGWRVPAHLFRFHEVAFQELARTSQVGASRRTVGRTGDDCLAFVMDENGRITKYLVVEAKCSLSHDSNLVNKAHSKFDDSVAVPVSLREVIEVLRANPSPENSRWQHAVFRLMVTQCQNAQRLNMVSYVCGQLPVRSSSWIPRTWTPTANPHQLYASRYQLEAVEVHLPSVAALIEDIYENQAVWDD